MVAPTGFEPVFEPRSRFCQFDPLVVRQHTQQRHATKTCSQKLLETSLIQTYGVAAVRIILAPLWGRAVDHLGARPRCGRDGITFMDLTVKLSPGPERPFHLAMFAEPATLASRSPSILAGLLASDWPSGSIYSERPGPTFTYSSCSPRWRAPSPPCPHCGSRSVAARKTFGRSSRGCATSPRRRSSAAPHRLSRSRGWPWPSHVMAPFGAPRNAVVP